jgi:ketosteroid isomerase-like protein
MSEENVEIARRSYTALAEEGVEAMLAFVHPEFEVATPPSLASEPDTFRGHAGVRRWFGAFSDGLEDVYFEGREFTDVGDQVLVETVLHARGRTTGIDVEQHAFILWTVREGKAVKADVFAERGPALEAAGLSE